MRKETENWWKQAEADLRSAEKNLSIKVYYVVAFLCQQAVEKALKALYLKDHKELLRIHDLVKLAREVNAPSEIIINCSKINPVYVAVRYPESDEMPTMIVSSQKAKELLVLSKEILTWIKKKL